MTKKDLIEQLTDVKNRIPTLRDKDIHPKVFEQIISRVFNQLVCDLSTKGIKNFQLLTRLFVNVAVQQDSNTDLYYSTLPIDISHLPDIRTGVRNVAPMTDNSVEFHPIDRNRITGRFNQTTSQISKEIFYVSGQDYAGNLTVDYIGMNSNNEVSTVKMYLILPFEAYGEDDQVHLPGGQDAILIENVMKIIQNTPKDIAYGQQPRNNA